MLPFVQCQLVQIPIHQDSAPGVHDLKSYFRSRARFHRHPLARADSNLHLMSPQWKSADSGNRGMLGGSAILSVVMRPWRSMSRRKFLPRLLLPAYPFTSDLLAFERPLPLATRIESRIGWKGGSRFTGTGGMGGRVRGGDCGRCCCI
ncbi:unnamed protein product [Tuber aestivum]|uniref:Uncharacterized protein n=1 Tax=Tuber aestivum TaxID=59557 RepID=A0A292Q8N9_9PEZI|nr:unnamed protein product [Tuber aestivum]